MFRAFNQGVEIPMELLGRLRESGDCSSSPNALWERLNEDGYLLLRSVIPPADILAAREEILTRLEEVGEIAPPAIEGIVTGTSRRLEAAPDPGRFWKSVSEGEALRGVTHGSEIRNLMTTLFDEPAVGHDLVYLRAAAPGRALDLHYDYPFFTRTTDRVLTVWIPLGDVPVTDGPLFMIEGSNRYAELIREIRAIEQTAPSTRKLSFDKSAIAFSTERRSRILTTDFRAGDVVIFTMLMAHGSLDNCSPINRARLSCDLRYQPEAVPRDERFFGPHPVGLTGEGYAGLNGAQPLTASWKTR